IYGFLLFAILAVFVAGLMVGRTPEYVGKKIEAREVKLAVLAIAVLPLAILGLTALSSVLADGLAGPLAKGPHGFSLHWHAHMGGEKAKETLDHLQGIKKVELPKPPMKK
ncbi:MAG: potassium-transporting ATPase subunit KdpA, partial [Armatimonadaceae bacterium]